LKKSGKLPLLLVLALALSLGLVASVWAQPMGKGMGHGPGMMNLTPEQAGKIFDLKEKMYVDTAGLRKQIMVKHAELAALYKAEKPDQNAIQAKQKELNALGDQMQEKMTALQLEAKKIAPDLDMGPGPGMGMGMGMCPGAGPPPPLYGTAIGPTAFFTPAAILTFRKFNVPWLARICWPVWLMATNFTRKSISPTASLLKEP
jgi:Spy/CpxP family protein refolding chaperone